MEGCGCNRLPPARLRGYCGAALHGHGAAGECGEGDDESARCEGGVSGVNVDAVVFGLFSRCELCCLTLRVYCTSIDLHRHGAESERGEGDDEGARCACAVSGANVDAVGLMFGL